jgi:hypothetical protein
MSPLLHRLLSRAFASVASAEANQAIASVRRERGDGGAAVQSYEVVVPSPGADEYLSATVFPRLVYFLDCRGVRLPGTPDVFVSLFASDRLYFCESGDVVSALAEAKGLTLEEARRRYGEGGTGDPRLLGA